jgi:gliding motility-associated-like protein
MLNSVRTASFALATVLLVFLSAGHATAQFTTVGSATSLGGNCYQIMAAAQCPTRGAIWNNTQINLSTGFDITFHVNVIQGSGVGFSADGMAFVLQNTGTAALAGTAGNTLGYANTTTGLPCPGGPHSGGITPSLAVELDFFENTNQCIAELPQDHIAIVRNGDFITPIVPPVCAFAGCGGNVESNTNACRTFRIIYVPAAAHLLQVYYNGALRINTNYNIIANVFGGAPNVYFGMTGSCGGLSSTQIVCWEFANAGADVAVCSGSPLNLGASGGTTYAWTPAASVVTPTSATTAFTQTTVTTYPLTVQVTNTYGCVDTDNMVVTVEANPTASPGANQTICLGDSVLIGPVVTNPNYTYSWSPATGLSATNVARPNASPPIGTTNYTLTIVDITTVNNCSVSYPISVTVNANPVANAGAPATICAGDTTPIGSATLPGMNYSWTPTAGLTNASISNPQAFPATTTTYQVVVTNGTTGCDDTASVTITVNPVPFADAGPPQVICSGQSVTLQGDSSGGNIVLWNNGGTLSSTTDITPDADPLITTTYTLTITNSVTGCSSTDQVLVTVNQTPVANAGANATVCAGDSTQIGVAPVGGINYNWNPSTGLSSTTVSNPMASPPAGTTQFYTLIATNPLSGCADTSIVSVQAHPAMMADAGADQFICLGQSVTLQGDSTGGDQVSWNNGGSLSSTTDITPDASPIVTTTYIVTITNSVTNCFETDSVVVTVNVPDPVTITTADTFICNVDTVDINTVSGPGIDQWVWTPTIGLSNPNDSSTFAFPTTSTTYIVTGTNTSTGCQAIDSIRINVFELDLSGLADDSICMGDTINLNVIPSLGSGNYQFSWTTPGGAYISDPTIGNPDVSSVVTTFFVVDVVDLTSTCSDQGIVTLTVSTLQASVTPILEDINPGQWVHLVASNGDFYTWTPITNISCINCQEVDVNPTTTTTYTVTISDSSGCTGTASATITVDSMIVQNVFTPNGDGINDLLTFNYLGVGEYEVFLYDRWGELIWTTKTPSAGWDGRTKGGADVPEGVYFVQVNIGDEAIPVFQKNTAWAVTLIR